MALVAPLLRTWFWLIVPLWITVHTLFSLINETLHVYRADVVDPLARGDLLGDRLGQG
jgi:hypothetical protein